jgi:hypothetical protein
MFGGANARSRDVCDLLLVERRIGDRVRKRRRAAPMIHFGLRSLRLEIAQDPRELRDLTVVEIELVREKSERPANAERSSTEAAKIAVVTMSRRKPNFPVAGAAAAAEGPTATPEITATTAIVGPTTHLNTPRRRLTTGKPPPIESIRMHFRTPLPGAIAPEGGFGAGTIPRAIERSLGSRLRLSTAAE